MCASAARSSGSRLHERHSGDSTAGRSASPRRATCSARRPTPSSSRGRSCCAKARTALAIGDGEGRNGAFLAEQGLDVLSVDYSPVAQDKARTLARERGVSMRVEQADVIDWGWPEASSTWSRRSSCSSPTPAQRAKMFAGIKRTLKSGGLLLMQGYGAKQLEYKTGATVSTSRGSTRANCWNRSSRDFSSLDIVEHDSVHRRRQRARRHVGADRSDRPEVTPSGNATEDPGCPAVSAPSYSTAGRGCHSRAACAARLDAQPVPARARVPVSGAAEARREHRFPGSGADLAAGGGDGT